MNLKCLLFFFIFIFSSYITSVERFSEIQMSVKYISNLVPEFEQFLKFYEIETNNIVDIKLEKIDNDCINVNFKTNKNNHYSVTYNKMRDGYKLYYMSRYHSE